MSGSPVEVFLENGAVLKISQTHFGLFISYDRSVVEEYTFGENREVTIGPIEAQRVSGWEDQSFVVETLDKTGATLFETWQISTSGNVLTRSIRISKSDDDSFTTQQTFDRIQK